MILSLRGTAKFNEQIVTSFRMHVLGERATCGRRLRRKAVSLHGELKGLQALSYQGKTAVEEQCIAWTDRCTSDFYCSVSQTIPSIPPSLMGRLIHVCPLADSPVMVEDIPQSTRDIFQDSDNPTCSRVRSASVLLAAVLVDSGKSHTASGHALVRLELL